MNLDGCLQPRKSFGTGLSVKIRRLSPNLHS